jgi:hypothetical protein
LIKLSTTQGDWGKHFVQTANISFNANETQVDWDDDGTADWDADDQLGFLPIGNNTTKFTGRYNGQNYTISNLFINRTTSDVGLFGYTDGANISNLHLRNVNISGRFNTGGFCGHNEGGTFYKCSVTGIVSGHQSVGGFVGYNDGSEFNTGEFNNCHSDCTVNATSNYTGGFTGYNKHGEYTYCYATGDVSGSNVVGGFTGQNLYGEYTYCYATGNVTGYSTMVAGFIASSSNANIYFCYSKGNAINNATSGVTYAGGFCGYSFSNNIQNCYSHGNASASSSETNNVGGFIARDRLNTSELTNCYSAGIPTATGTGTNNVGGFVGDLDAFSFSNYSCCYWGFEGATLYDSGNYNSYADPDEILKISPEDFADPTTFAGCFNFEDGTWMMNNGYPVLTELTIPTLTEWAVIIFIGLLAGVGGVFVWRRIA